MKRNRRPAPLGNSIERAKKMEEEKRALETGLYVAKQSSGWAVIHHQSGLSAAFGLRQRRFAEEAMSDLLATGVDFTQPSKVLSADRSQWKEVYYKWLNRSYQKGLDRTTFEYYSHSVHAGMIVPTSEQASKCRDLIAQGGTPSEALDLLYELKKRD